MRRILGIWAVLLLVSCARFGAEGPGAPAIGLLAVEVEGNTAHLTAVLEPVAGVEAVGFYVWQEEMRQLRFLGSVENGRISCRADGLEYGTAYQFVAFVSNGRQEVRSSEGRFETGAAPATPENPNNPDNPETPDTPTPQGTDVSDPTLLAWLLQRYDIDRDGTLSEEEKSKVTEVARDHEDTPYTSLAGLGQFPNLQHLLVSDCPLLKEVDLSGNPRLDWLEMNNVGVRKFDLSANPALISVSVQGNSLEEIDLSANPRITSLWVSENRLQALDVSMLPRLELLHCRENPLTVLDLRNNPDLKELIATGCPSLQYIYLHPDADLLHLEADAHTQIVK